MHQDLKELIELLASHEVEFLVVGAHALAFHARPRYTEDLDLWLRKSQHNFDKLQKALEGFGLPIRSEALQHLLKHEKQMIVLGVEPNAVDLLNFLDGLEFEEAWSERVPGVLAGVPVNYISLEHFLVTKRASGRPKDLLDIQLVEEQQKS